MLQLDKDFLVYLDRMYTESIIQLRLNKRDFKRAKNISKSPIYIEKGNFKSEIYLIAIWGYIVEGDSFVVTLEKNPYYFDLFIKDKLN